jgi:hypothetical protein
MKGVKGIMETAEKCSILLKYAEELLHSPGGVEKLLNPMMPELFDMTNRDKKIL